MARSAASLSLRGANVTSKGRARKAVPFFQRAPGHRARGGRAAVPALLERHRLGAAGHLERELQRVLVGLGAAVDAEHGVESEARELDQARGGALADRHRQRVGLERHLPRLALERGHPSRMAVAQARRRRGRRRNRGSCGRRARTARRPRRARPRWGIARTPAPDGTCGPAAKNAERSPWDTSGLRVASSPAGRGGSQPGRLSKAQQPVHPLHRRRRRRLCPDCRWPRSRRSCGRRRPRSSAHNCWPPHP